MYYICYPGWHQQINGHESDQTPGNSGGQGSLECYRPWDFKESDMTERPNNNNMPASEKGYKN